MNFNLDQIAAAATARDTQGGELSLPKAIVGAIGGALIIALVYGVVGHFVREFSFLAIMIGSASGLAAVKLGGRATPVVGALCAATALVAVLAAKVIVGAPAGWSWIAWHMQIFDIAFCYIANPVAAFVAGGTGAGRGLLTKLPF